MRAVRLDDDRIDDEPGDGRPVRVRADDRLVDELLDDDDDAVGGEGGFLLAAGQAPDLRVPVRVGPLGVDDRDVRPQGRDDVDLVVAIRGRKRADERVRDREVGRVIRPQREEGESHRAGRIAPDHAEVAVLLELE